MQDPTENAGRTDRPERTPPPSEETGSPQNEFYRGGERTAVDMPSVWSRPWPSGLESDRPPGWLLVPLVLFALLDGFLVYSTVWRLLGDDVLAIPLATLVGICVGSGTIVAGRLVWIRLTDETVIAEY